MRYHDQVRSDFTITARPFRLKPGEKDSISVWYSLESLVNGYTTEFEDVAKLSIAAIERIRIPQFPDIRLIVEQTGSNPNHVSIKGFPENLVVNKEKLRLIAEQLSEVAEYVKQSEWAALKTKPSA